MDLNLDAFLQSLPIMGKGMLGIFIVTLVIIGIMLLLNAVTGRKKKKSDDAPSE